MSCGQHPQWTHAAEDCPLCREGASQDDADARELIISLGQVVASLVNWARSRQPGYPFDHNGECLFCDEMGEHAKECPWPVVERSVFGQGESG